MDEMGVRHSTAAQHVQARLVKALTDNEPITADLLRAWSEAVRIERSAFDDGDLGFDPPEPTGFVVTLDDAQLAALGSAVRRENRRRKARRDAR